MGQHDSAVNYLNHYGILGMRWGFRKDRRTGRIKKTGKAKTSYYEQKEINKYGDKSEDFKRAQALKKKKPSELTNEELKVLTTRMQLDRQYKDLSKSEIASGNKFVQDIFKESAKDTAKGYVVQGMKFAIEAAIQEAKKK